MDPVQTPQGRTGVSGDSPGTCQDTDLLLLSHDRLPSPSTGHVDTTDGGLPSGGPDEENREAVEAGYL